MATTSEIPRSLRDGRYAVIGLLAEGSQGVTLDAVDKRRGCPVAIKRFQVKGARSWKDVELAEREARVLSSLSHPALPEHIEHFEEDGALYLVMEKIEGETLATLREQRGSLSREEVVNFVHDVAGILSYLHGRDPPVIHRDIKPGNVIRRSDGSFALVDFGSVRDRLKLKGGSTVVGTFGYMAPEQFQGRALPASDVYAVGATAVSLLSGLEPEDLPHQGLAIDVATALRDRKDPVLVNTLQALLTPNPDQRSASLEAALVALPRPAGKARRATREQRHDTGRKAARSRAPSQGTGASTGRSSTQGSQQTAASAQTKRGSDRDRKGLGLPPLIAVIAVLGLVIARIGVSLGLRVVVPMVLAVLSLLFGRTLLAAARHVREAGRRAGQALRGAQHRVRGPGAGHRAGRRHRRERAGRRRRGRTGRRRDHESPSPEQPTEAPARGAASHEAVAPKRSRIDEKAAAGPRIAADGLEADGDEEMREALAEIEDAFAEAEDELRRR